MGKFQEQSLWGKLQEPIRKSLWGSFKNKACGGSFRNLLGKAYGEWGTIGFYFYLYYKLLCWFVFMHSFFFWISYA
jgi:hypothetical protein